MVEEGNELFDPHPFIWKMPPHPATSWPKKLILVLWGAKGPAEPEAPKNSKQRKSIEKVTQSS